MKYMHTLARTHIHTHTHTHTHPHPKQHRLNIQALGILVNNSEEERKTKIRSCWLVQCIAVHYTTCKIELEMFFAFRKLFDGRIAKQIEWKCMPFAVWKLSFDFELVSTEGKTHCKRAFVAISFQKELIENRHLWTVEQWSIGPILCPS